MKVIVQHIFEAQYIGGEILKGAYRHAAKLQVFEYGEGARIWLPTTTYTYKALEDASGENTILATVGAPTRELVVEREGSGERLTVSNLTFSKAFPASIVFKKYFLQRDESDYDADEPRAAKDSFYYVRATDEFGNSIVEGVVYVPFRLRYTDATGLAKIQVNGVETLYHQTDQFQVRLVSPAVELQRTPIIDSKTDRIEYSDSMSSGKGFADFLYRKFSRDYAISKAELLQSFAIYLNRESELAECGILSVQDISNEDMTHFYGVGQIGFLQRNASVAGHIIEETYSEHDILEEKIWLDEFLLSDDYGWSLTENQKGEKRDLGVERTRGLRDGSGRFAANETDYSFLKEESAMALMKRIAESCQLRFSFEIVNENNTQTDPPTTTQYVRINFRRDFHDGKAYRYNRYIDGFEFVRENIVRIDKRNVDVFGNVVGGDVDTSGRREIEFEPKPILKVRVSEINGSGIKRAELDGELARYDLINELNEYDGEDYGVRQAITPKRALEVENLFASNRIEEPYRFGSAHQRRVVMTVTVPANQSISSDTFLKEFLKRKRVGNKSFLSIVPGETIVGNTMTFEVDVALCYFVRYGDEIRIFEFFAQAQLEYCISRLMSLLRVVVRDVVLIRVAGIHFFNEATLLITNTLNEIQNDTMRRYMPIDVRVDEVAEAVEGDFEQVKEPFDREYPEPSDEIMGLYSVYDEYYTVDVPRHVLGAVRRRRQRPANQLAVDTGLLGEENRREGDGFCAFAYASGNGVLNDSYRGATVRWAIRDGAEDVELSIFQVIEGRKVYFEDTSWDPAVVYKRRAITSLVSDLKEVLSVSVLGVLLSKPGRWYVRLDATIDGIRYSKTTFIDVFSGFVRIEAKHGAHIRVQNVQNPIAFQFQARFACQSNVLLYYSRQQSGVFGTMRRAIVLSSAGDLFVVLAWQNKLDSRVLRHTQLEKRLGRQPRFLSLKCTLNGSAIDDIASMNIYGAVDGETFSNLDMSRGLIGSSYMNQFNAWLNDIDNVIFETAPSAKCHVDFARLFDQNGNVPIFDLSFNHVGHFLGTDFWIDQSAVPRFYKNKSNSDGSLNDNHGFTELTTNDVTGEIASVDGRIFGKF